MMSTNYSICVRPDDLYEENIPIERLREALAVTMAQYAVPSETGVTLLLTGDQAVQKLNKRYLGHDAPTDVLSFPAGEDDFECVDEPPYLGDIIIAYPYTAAQAVADGHAVDDVLVLLAVHGMLHLLGFDHDTPEHQAAMWSAQEVVLRKLSVSPDVMRPLYDMTPKDDD